MRNLLVLSLLALACSGEAARDVQPIIVGHVAPLTGGVAAFGQGERRGALLAFEEVNAAGGLHGRPVKLLSEDDESKPEQAPTVVAKLIARDNAVAIIGESTSSGTLAAAPICQARRVPMLSPSATNPEVTKRGDYIFRTCFIDPYQGAAVARFAATDLKLKRAAILRDIRTDYSQGLAQYFKETFEKLGGTVVADQSYSSGDSDFRSQLTSIRSAKPAFIFAPGYYTEIAQAIVQARDLGITQPFLGGDGWDSPRLYEIGGNALDGCFFATHYVSDSPDPLVRKFVDKYRARYGEVPDSAGALGYDAGLVMLDAIRRAKTVDGPAIRDALAATRDFPGASGRITIGPDRNALKPLIMLEIERGRAKYRSTVPPPS